MPSHGISTSRGFTRVSPFRPGPLPLSRRRRTWHMPPPWPTPTALSRATAPPRAAADAAGFPILCGARSRDRGPSRRPMRRERRRQDQSPRGAVAARRRAAACAGRSSPNARDEGGTGGFTLSVEVEEEGERISSARAVSPADGDAGAERRNRIDRAPVASSRAFSDHVRVVWLTPAMDSLFAGPASERRRFLDRFVLAIDPASRRAGRPVRAGVARAQPAPRGGRAQRRSGSTRSSARRPSSASPSPRRGSNA